MVVLESETKVAFCSEVYIGVNEYGETYSFSILKSFKPNTWTVYILDLIDKVLFEANHFRQKETEKENQEDIKNNYL